MIFNIFVVWMQNKSCYDIDAVLWSGHCPCWSFHLVVAPLLSN